MKSSYELKYKRLFDIILSLIALIIFAPVMLVVAVLVRKKLGKPVIFAQLRPGLNEKIFKMYKFRTMTDERDANGTLLSDEKRLTPFGKFLRSSSLDELPELFNVLKGEMSLVGPRPQLVKDMFFMTTEQRLRHTVMPGITGLAQVNGRNNITWENKFRYDLIYIKEVSFFNDMKILFQTLYKVIKKDGVTTEGMETAEDLGDYLLRKGMICDNRFKNKIDEVHKLIITAK